MTSFLRYNDVIITSCVQWESNSCTDHTFFNKMFCSNFYGVFSYHSIHTHSVPASEGYRHHSVPASEGSKSSLSYLPFWGQTPGRHRGTIKLRSHMRGAVAERRRADFDIPLRHRGAGRMGMFTHVYAVRTRADLPFLEDKDGLERAVSKRTRKIGCWTHLLRSGFCSRSASAPRPRMCECMQWFLLKPIFRPPPTAHVWTYLNAGLQMPVPWWGPKCVTLMPGDALAHNGLC